jgi:hypothetical protein
LFAIRLRFESNKLLLRSLLGGRSCLTLLLRLALGFIRLSFRFRRLGLGRRSRLTLLLRLALGFIRLSFRFRLGRRCSCSAFPVASSGSCLASDRSAFSRRSPLASPPKEATLRCLSR